MPHGPRRILELSWRERWWFARALVLLPIAALAARWVPLGRLTAFIDAYKTTAAADPAVVDRIAHMVAAAGVFGPYRATCLPQSLVLQWLLGREGIDTRLRYGVRRVAGRLTAHCWVEFGDRPLIDSVAVRQHFDVLEPAAAPVRGVP